MSLKRHPRLRLVPGFPSAIRVFALTHSRRIVFSFFHRHRTLIVSSGVLLTAAVVYGSFTMSGRLRSRTI